MNVAVYLFGEFNNGYTQYPDDFTKTIFQNFYSNATSTTQIAIHREGNLMYYGYIRKLELNRYIGFCVVINGLMLTKLEGLFSLFENTIFTLVSNGQLVHFNEQGNIVTNVDKLFMNQEEIDLITQSFRTGFHHFQNTVKPLPAINFSISKDSKKRFSIDNDLDEILKSSHTNGYTFIFKSKDFNHTQLNSIKSLLERLNNEKTELTSLYKKLENEHKKTIKQKKQYRFVTILFILAFGSLIGLISLNNNLNSTISALNTAKSTIKEQSSLLTNKENQITSIVNENQVLHRSYQNIKNEFDRLKSLICQRQSFFIRKSKFDFNTGYLSFDYYGLVRDTLDLQVHTYKENETYFITTAKIYVNIGENTQKIFLNEYLNEGDWYSFVIMQDNIVLGGDRH